MKTPLGKLEKVELRDFWKDEAKDFTGCIFVDGEPKLIKNKYDIKAILREIEEYEKIKFQEQALKEKGWH